MREQKPNEIESLLGQATLRPWKTEEGLLVVDGEGYLIADCECRSISSEQDEDKANAQLIVLAVNAMPATLALREAAQDLLRTGSGKMQRYKLNHALSEVDTALGLSPEPSSTPVDTMRKRKDFMSETPDSVGAKESNETGGSFDHFRLRIMPSGEHYKDRFDLVDAETGAVIASDLYLWHAEKIVTAVNSRRLPVSSAPPEVHGHSEKNQNQVS